MMKRREKFIKVAKPLIQSYLNDAVELANAHLDASNLRGTERVLLGLHFGINFYISSASEFFAKIPDDDVESLLDKQLAGLRESILEEMKKNERH